MRRSRRSARRRSSRIQKGDSRSKDAQEAWGKILDTHNYVVVNVSDEVKAAPGLVVVVDGAAVPEAQFNGEVFRPTATHEVVVSAAAHQDLRLPAVQNKQPVTILLGESSGPLTAPPPPPPSPETSSGGWGWQKWTGTGLMALGVGGVAYSLVSFLSYKSDESSLADTRASSAAGCTGTPTHVDSCPGVAGDVQKLRANDAIAAYDANERSAKDSEPVWIVVGAAGVVLIGSGIYLFATAPSRSSEPPPPMGGVHVHVIPQVGLHDTGLGVVGTF